MNDKNQINEQFQLLTDMVIAKSQGKGKDAQLIIKQISKIKKVYERLNGEKVQNLSLDEIHDLITAFDKDNLLEPAISFFVELKVYEQFKIEYEKLISLIVKEVIVKTVNAGREFLELIKQKSDFQINAHVLTHVDKRDKQTIYLVGHYRKIEMNDDDDTLTLTTPTGQIDKIGLLPGTSKHYTLEDIITEGVIPFELPEDEPGPSQETESEQSESTHTAD